VAQRRLGYVPALDGLRGIAILIVVAFHLFGLPRGGPVGVDLFFALSGFLITTLLLEELAERGRVNLWRFYERRARRLFPALAVLLAVYLAWNAAHGHDALKTAALGGLYFSNFVQSFSNPNPLLYSGLDHLWSLAQEEQFYFVWPLLLVLITRSKRALVWASLLLAAMLAYRTGLLLSGARITRVYRGPDTHGVGLMSGAILAMLAFRRPLRVRESVAKISFLGVLFLAVIQFWNAEWWLYFQPLVELGCVVLVGAALFEPVLSEALSFRPLVWVGKISYSLYLWHWTVFWALKGRDPLLALAISLLLAWASYRFVELPFRRRRVKPVPAPTTQPIETVGA
jgi:peptidoglycan/LPS O-acetylase OafA/YrhL